MSKKSLPTACDEYLGYLRTTKAKSPLTIDKEGYALEKWCASLGGIAITKIKLAEIREFVTERAEEGVSNRTINLDVQALHNLLRHFQSAGALPVEKLPTEIWPRLKHTTPLRDLIPDDAITKLITAAQGAWIGDYVKLLAYSGARKTAGISARWGDVDWTNKVFTYRSKFDKTIRVNFNPRLDDFLQGFHARSEGRNAAGEFMFPSDGPTGHWVEPQATFVELREAAGLPDITLHDFRHYFISKAVMAGIDFLTIARWVGHADGGVLIGKVYGHLNNDHLQKSAAKLSL